VCAFQRFASGKGGEALPQSSPFDFPETGVFDQAGSNRPANSRWS
jgi:hypothetical protein